VRKKGKQKEKECEEMKTETETERVGESLSFSSASLRAAWLFRFAKRALPAAKQKSPPTISEGSCARDWIRTSTPFPAPPPQGGASTNFATRATLETRNLTP
jgi:hypothetical protein